MIKANWLQLDDFNFCIRDKRKGYAHVKALVERHPTSEWPSDEVLTCLVDGTFEVQDGIVSRLHARHFGGHIEAVSPLVKSVYVCTD